jgi:hypothetical protein
VGIEKLLPGIENKMTLAFYFRAAAGGFTKLGKAGANKNLCPRCRRQYMALNFPA